MKRNKPEIRFIGFDEDWIEKPLIELLSLLKDGTHGTHEDVLEGPYLLSAKNIKNGQIVLDDTDRKISIEDYQSIHKSFKLEKKDVLLTIVGSIGQAALLEDPNNLTFQRSVAFLRANNSVTPDFLYCLTQSPSFQSELNLRKSMSAQAGIYLNALSSINVNIPNKKDEMIKIGSLLIQMNNLIWLKQEKYNKLTSIKETFLEKMLLSKKEKKPEIRFSGFSKDWEERLLGKNSKITTGQCVTTSESFDCGYPIISGGKEPMGFYNIFNRNPNTVTVARAGTAGYVSYQKERFYLNDKCFSVENDEDYTSLFLYYLLKKEQANLESMKSSSSVPTINTQLLKSLVLSWTEKPEQERISSFLDVLDQNIALLKSSIEKTIEIKKTLLEKMFA